MRVATASSSLVVRRPTVDGAAFCEATLRGPRAPGRRVVVFDIDNTLVDTRHRTLGAAQSFGRKHGLAAFADARLEQIAPRCSDTCRLLGVHDPAVHLAFKAHWLEVFWDTKNWTLDRPIPEMVRLAKRARAHGFEVLYLTGRIDKAATLTQLRRCGLPAHEHTLVTKPAVGMQTDAFKRAWLKKLSRHAQVGWFLTEGRRDLAALLDLRLPLVRLEFPHEPADVRLPADIPVLSLRSLK